MKKQFMNTSPIRLAGINPGEVGMLEVNSDGLLATRENRELAKAKHLQAVVEAENHDPVDIETKDFEQPDQFSKRGKK